jgi:outer membrane protein W
MCKKIIILSSILVACISPVMSQTLSIGPVVGVNVSKFTPNQYSKNLAGLSVGALANYSVNEKVGLSAKVLFSQLGSKFTNSGAINRLNYLQMPISLVYYFGIPGDKFRPKIYAGPYFGTLLSAKNENKNRIVDTQNNDVYKKLDLGGQLGLGFNYSLKDRTWLNLDLGYGKSFTDITIADLTKEYNTAFTFQLGLSFPIAGN